MRAALLLWLLLGAVSVAQARTHVVQSGDTIRKIAKANGCTIEELMQANGRTSSKLQIGDKLTIPTCKPPKREAKEAKAAIPAGPGTHVVAQGDTFARIAKQYGCKTDAVVAANPDAGKFLHLGQVVRVPKDCAARPKPARTIEAKPTEIIKEDPGWGGDERPEDAKTPDAKTPDAKTPDAKTPDDAKPAKAEKKPGKKPKKEPRRAGRHPPDHATLERLMRARGFSPPSGFRALVVDITLSGGKIQSEKSFDWKGLSTTADGWNPASTVKLFSAIGALEYVRSLGFGPNTQLTLTDRGRRKRVYNFAELVTAAIDPSDNIAHNRLAQIAGYDYLNGRVLTSSRGIHHAGIHRPYYRSAWLPLSGEETLKYSPPMELKAGKKVKKLGARKGKGSYYCAGSAACASLADLAEAMRRVMLHEQLPAGERYKLGSAELKVLRNALKARRKRGMELVTGIESAFKPGEVTCFHKPGFSGDWESDVIYVFHKSKKRWIVVAAGHGGRGVTANAGRVIGKILKAGELDP